MESDALVKLLHDHAPEIGARPEIHVQGCSCAFRATDERALVDLAGEQEHLAHLAAVIEAHYAETMAEEWGADFPGYSVTALDEQTARALTSKSGTLVHRYVTEWSEP